MWGVGAFGAEIECIGDGINSRGVGRGGIFDDEVEIRGFAEAFARIGIVCRRQIGDFSSDFDGRSFGVEIEAIGDADATFARFGLEFVFRARAVALCEFNRILRLIGERNTAF